ncbi:MAG: DUF6090 family protein [Maribacter arcticus]|uniref:DUF6090 family protein n=1 Tax=Maribacter arcticus TaxID=561365 RepID=UPI003003332A
MIKFFRKIRQNLLNEGKTGKYIKYAIGEIFLVVIGILIALQINNWNEARKDKKYLNRVYTQIKNDLQKDTLEMGVAIKLITEKNKRLTAIIDGTVSVSYYDTINVSNHEKCEKCRSDVTDFNPFQNLDKGYQLLKAMNTDQNLKTDSFSLKIDAFYTDYNVFVTKGNSTLLNLIATNISDYQKYDWFVPWSAFIGSQFYTEEFLTYIFESKENRVKSANYLIFSKWYSGNLKSFKQDATQIVLLLEEQLNE